MRRPAGRARQALAQLAVAGTVAALIALWELGDLLSTFLVLTLLVGLVLVVAAFAIADLGICRLRRRRGAKPPGESPSA